MQRSEATMPPLKNLRHEKFAQELLNKDTNTEAYKAAYPGVSEASAGANSSKLLNTSNIRERILELMSQNKATTPSHVVERLGQHVDSENEGISMDAIKTSMKAFGAFDEAPKDVTFNQVNITFTDPKSS